jgi:hypothetical protein
MAMPDAPDMMPVAAPLPELSPRDRFRRLLHDRAGCADDVAWYLDQAIGTFPTDPQVRLAVEELVDHLGRFLHFAPERDEHLGCSIWTSTSAARLAVVLEEPSIARTRLPQFARLRDGILTSGAIHLEAQVSVLCVVCGDDPRGSLEEAVTIRRAPDQLRLVTLGGLVTLARLVETGQVTHLAAVQILRPARALADPLISLLGRVRPA